MKTNLKYILIALVIIIGLFIVFLIARDIYSVWFLGENWKEGTNFAGKTLWDWLELLIVPIVLGIGALWFNRQEKFREQELAQDRQLQDALQSYLDKMSELLLKEDLYRRHADKGEAVRDVAQTRTVTILRFLDRERRDIATQFLRDAGLADGLLSGASLSKISLAKTNLNNVNLSGANLNGADLSGTYLGGADLSGAKLRGTNLNSAFLEDANLKKADLFESNLSKARLWKADMRDALLAFAQLRGAYFSETDLRGANMDCIQYVTDEQLSQAILDETTILPDGTHWQPPGDEGSDEKG